MNRNLIAPLTLLLGLFFTGCGGPRPPRGDFVLIIAQSSPTTASPHFDKLVAGGLVFEGELARPGAKDSSSKSLLSEVLSGQRAGQEGGMLYETRPVLPLSAKLAGYRVLGTTKRASTIAELELQNGFDYGFFGGATTDEETGLTTEVGLGAGATEALKILAADYEAMDVTRAPVLFFGDAASTQDAGALEELLAALTPELLIGVAADATATTPTTVLILFLAEDSPVRAVIAGPDVVGARSEQGVDPRDIFPTIARKGGIPATALLLGVNVPSFLAGRNLLDGQ